MEEFKGYLYTVLPSYKLGDDHALEICNETDQWYHKRSSQRGSSHIGEWTCPACGKTTRRPRNFVARKTAACDGYKIKFHYVKFRLAKDKALVIEQIKHGTIKGVPVGEVK